MLPAKITVLMSVYNGGNYLRDAIESILKQTFVDFEFLIINDASTDDTVDILESYRDSRIHIIHNQTNIGLTRSLNIGLRYAQGKYIARMDADDISQPTRLEKQFMFMERAPSVGVCGTSVRTIGNGDGVTIVPEDDRSIRCRLLFHNVLAHSSVVMRKKTLQENNLEYSGKVKYAQDYDLWVKFAEHSHLANLPDILLFRRIHKDSIGQSLLKMQQQAAREIRDRLLLKVGIKATEDETELHSLLAESKIDQDESFLHRVDLWLRKLQDANNMKHFFPEPVFCEVLAERWYVACQKSQQSGIPAWKIFRASPFSAHVDISLRKKVFFFVKSFSEIFAQ